MLGSRGKCSIKLNKRKISVGYFADEDDAGRAYNDAALLYFGEFANLNQVGAL
jgi:hypothetical protein